MTAMRGLGAVVHKELLEVLGDRHARRGGYVQGAMHVLVLGVLLPASQADLWRARHPVILLFFALLPGVAAASVAADAFAGERERHTLETLLSTPLAPRTILAGKTLAAVAWGALVAAVSLVAATITVSMASGPFVPSPLVVFGALGAAVASSLVMSSVAIVISMKVPVARATQQIAAIATFVLGAAGVATWKALGIAGTWTHALLAEGAVALSSLVVLELAGVLFRRGALFENQ
jgi:ABC-2 type transport system permease protein